MKHRELKSPIGRLLLGAQDVFLRQIRLLSEGKALPFVHDPMLDEAERQLHEYFDGKRRAFDLPIMPSGSAFERAVWQKLAEIPFGEIRSYGQIAKALGRPNASRAVGGACSRNPLLIVVPCHRIVAGTGKLTGFAAGMPAKRSLLALEGWSICSDTVKNK